MTQPKYFPSNNWGKMVKPKPQTNEEWLRSCNTEQLAETLAWIEDRGELPTVCKENVKAFEKWLKQPHKPR